MGPRRTVENVPPFRHTAAARLALGLLGVALFLPLLAARVLGEEAMLLDGPPGYRDYAANIRFRILPGVW